MITKKGLWVMLMLMSISSMGAQSATWKMQLKALDTDGNPIEGVMAQVGYYAIKGPHLLDAERGLTDADGAFQASANSPNVLSLTLTKEGYYQAYQSRYEFEVSRLGRWYPWDPEIVMVMKAIRNPVKMLRKWEGKTMPDGDNAVGYDLEVGDWVSPYGKGRRTDFVLSAESWAESHTRYDGTLTMTFPNEGDGIQEFRVDLPYDPGLLSDYEAPDSGYASELKLRSACVADEFGYDKYIGKRDEDQHFYLRTRTELDGSGNVVSAHYTKIMGGIGFFPAWQPNLPGRPKGFPETYSGPGLSFHYYFNPNGNDRNMEHDATAPPLPGSHQ